MSALAERGGEPAIVTVAHELTAMTQNGLASRLLKLVISHPIPAVAGALVLAMAEAAGGSRQAAPASLVLPFSLHTAENI